MEVDGYQQLFGYQHGWKYVVCVQQKKETSVEG